MKIEGDDIRQSDVTFWGMATLIMGAVAVLSLNLGSILPNHVLTGLHATRLQGGSLNQIRAQVAQLQEQTVSLRSQNEQLASRLRITERGTGTVAQRIGAIEASLPGLMEALPEGQRLDAFTTAGIDDAPTELLPVEGGQLAVSKRPLAESAPQPATAQELPPEPQAMPGTASAKPAATAMPEEYDFGIALGPDVPAEIANESWVNIANRAGPLLLGLGPLLSGEESEERRQLVAGPIKEYSEAELICSRMIRIGISCLPVPYVGAELPE